MSRAQQLRNLRRVYDPDDDIDFYSFDFGPLLVKNIRKGERECFPSRFNNSRYFPRLATMLLKFGRKGHAHETIVWLSEDKKYIEWKGRWMSRKKKAERRGKSGLLCFKPSYGSCFFSFLRGSYAVAAWTKYIPLRASKEIFRWCRYDLLFFDIRRWTFTRPVLSDARHF